MFEIFEIIFKPLLLILQKFNYCNFSIKLKDPQENIFGKCEKLKMLFPDFLKVI